MQKFHEVCPQNGEKFVRQRIRQQKVARSAPSFKGPEKMVAWRQLLTSRQKNNADFRKPKVNFSGRTSVDNSLLL